VEIWGISGLIYGIPCIVGEPRLAKNNVVCKILGLEATMEERIRDLERQFGRKLTAREKFYVAMEEACRDKSIVPMPPPPGADNLDSGERCGR